LKTLTSYFLFKNTLEKDTRTQIPFEEFLEIGKKFDLDNAQVENFVNLTEQVGSFIRVKVEETDNIIIKPIDFYSKVCKASQIDFLKKSREEKQKRISEITLELSNMTPLKTDIEKKALSTVQNYSYITLIYLIIQSGFLFI
jgi:prefoldin subunit 5